MPMISYSQNGEDVLLNRLFPADYRGFYVDVGASHPVAHSVTKHFHDRGWRGVNVEPSPRTYALYAPERPDDINLNCGISDSETTLRFHESVDSLGMSTFVEDFAGGLARDGFRTEVSSVPVITLRRLFDEHIGDRTVDFLKIDVEAHEYAVISGGDWERHRPRVVVVEATYDRVRWEPILLDSGYVHAAFDGLNRYYLRLKDQHLAVRLEAPANVLDDFVRYEDLCALEGLRHQLAESRAEAERLRAEVAALRGVLAEVGPTALRVARRLHLASRRFPGLAAPVRRALRRGA